MYICFHVNEDLSVPVLCKCCKVSQLINRTFMAKYMLGIVLNNFILIEKMVTRKHDRS